MFPMVEPTKLTGCVPWSTSLFTLPDTLRQSIHTGRGIAPRVSVAVAAVIHLLRSIDSRGVMRLEAMERKLFGTTSLGVNLDSNEAVLER
jgi:hypothetical protein